MILATSLAFAALCDWCEALAPGEGWPLAGLALAGWWSGAVLWGRWSRRGARRRPVVEARGPAGEGWAWLW